MNKEKALEILGFSPGSDPDEKEIKKAFKKKAVKLHPDVNKDDDAEEKFKELNAAQDCLLNPQPEFQDFSGFQQQAAGYGFPDWFNMGPRVRFSVPPIRKTIRISFRDAVLGSRQTIKVDKKARCDSCLCPSCNGAGSVEQMRQQGPMIFSQRFTCPECKGAGRHSDICNPCQGKGTVKKTSEFSVRIPGGVHNGASMRLRGFGNVENHNGQLYPGDIVLVINVEQDKDMRIKESNVISNIDVSLLDALKGTKKKVRTVLGDINLTISKNTKHRDTLVVRGYGVERKGDHHFIVNLIYPKDTQKIIKALEDE